MTRFNQFFLEKLKFDHIFFSFWNLRILKNCKQVVGGLHRMRIFVLIFLIYYTFSPTSYAKVIAVLHFPYTFCKTCPNLSFQIFLTSRCSNITTSRRILFFEVFIIFFCFLQNRKGDPRGGGVEFQNGTFSSSEGFYPSLVLWHVPEGHG